MNQAVGLFKVLFIQRLTDFSGHPCVAGAKIQQQLAVKLLIALQTFESSVQIEAR